MPYRRDLGKEKDTSTPKMKGIYRHTHTTYTYDI